MELETIRDNIRSVINRLPDILVEVLEDSDVFINELIRMQLRQGQRGDGQLITPTYSEAYAKKKGITVPNLKVTGKFYSDIYTEVSKQFITIDANTKTSRGFELGQHLQKRYTEKIFILTEKSLDKLKEKVIPELINKVYNEIYG